MTDSAIPLLLLTVAEEMALGGPDADRDLLVFESEIVANQYFNASVDPAHLTGRFVRRWLELPATTDVTPSFDLKATFEEATGCALWDVSTIALGFWAAVDVGQTRFNKSYFARLGWEPERLDRVWRLLSADRDQMRGLIELEREQLGDESLSWAFSPFERYPLFRLPDDNVIVLSPDLLVRRVFGWLPFFDVRSTLSGKKRGQFERFFRKVTEAYAVEVLASIATDRGLRFYNEAEIEAAYAADGVQLADTVIEAVDAFIVTEIGTHQLTRETVAGVSHAKLQTDLAAILEKARQVHSTILQLRADEERLTGQSPLPGRRYYPIVVATEGFPANPVTLTRLWDLLRKEGLLQEPRVAPLQVLDLIELEMVEGAQEDGGPSFRSLLDSKERGGMARASLRDHMVAELGLRPSRPHRLDALWQQPFDIAAAQLDADFDPSETA